MCCLLIVFLHVQPVIMVRVRAAQPEPLHPVVWRA